MQVKAVFSEKQPDYRYMPLGDGRADVFINKFIEKIKDEEDGSTSFIYDHNEFRVNANEITEENIKENPMDYLDYSNEVVNVPLEERISAMEDAFMELSEVIFNG